MLSSLFGKTTLSLPFLLITLSFLRSLLRLPSSAAYLFLIVILFALLSRPLLLLLTLLLPSLTSLILLFRLCLHQHILLLNCGTVVSVILVLKLPGQLLRRTMLWVLPILALFRTLDVFLALSVRVLSNL